MGNSMMNIRRRVVMSQPHLVTTAPAGVATFNTDMKAPLKELKVNIEPVQDLHGQEAPYPPGGGKNKFNWDRERGTPNPSASTNTTSPRVMDTNHYYVGLTRNNYYGTNNITNFSVENDVISATITGGGYGIGFPVAVDGNTTYTVSFKSATNGKISVGFYDANWDYISDIDNIRTFTTPENAAYVTIIVTAINIGEFSMTGIQMGPGSTTTEWSPYSNICPISGWTEANVARTGKNLVNISIENGGAAVTKVLEAPIVCPCVASFKKSADYAESEDVWRICGTLKDGTKKYGFATEKSVNIWSEISESNPLISIEIRSTRITAGSITAQLERGSTASDFEAYTGTIIPIEFPSSAGTVFGSELAVNEDGTGQLVVDRISHVFTSSDVIRNNGITDMSTDSISPITRVSYDKTQNSSWLIEAAPVATDAQNKGKYSHGRYIGNNSGWASKSYHGYAAGAAAHIFIKCEATASAVAAYLDEQNSNGTPVQLLYPISTPIAYTLTAAQVTTILGTNNVWSDAGDVELSYWTHTP